MEARGLPWNNQGLPPTKKTAKYFLPVVFPLVDAITRIVWDLNPGKSNKLIQRFKDLMEALL